jgi:hypothetical protein
MTDSPDAPGVYMVAGNRGVGKTSLINEVIKATSLRQNSMFSENLKYLVLLLAAVAGTFVCLHEQGESADTFGVSVIGVIWIIFGGFFIYLAVVFSSMCVRFFGDRWRENRKTGSDGCVTFFKIIFYDMILKPIKHYRDNYSRLYLRINFGHKLKDEKDILRLVARILSTEYAKYRRSFWRMLPWRAMGLCFLIFLTCLFCSVVNIGKSKLDKDYLKDISSAVETTVETRVEAKAGTKVETKIETKIGNSSNVGTNTSNLLLELGQFVKNVIHSTYYQYWLPFLLMYLFSVLLFRSTWITHFFVTHRVISRRLKRLNDDITHSTERENSIRVGESAGAKIGTRNKKSRNVADAREIEKELQDILADMGRIPGFMCRPNVVIVFDELDKVEPGDASLEKEAPQTKASMFSIGATRERQTEILRILSNMKYFLSTVRAKFIFIAGREMFDIHLADVSERNNYIGSIFNMVIQVPSFLTDHPTGKKSIREESSIASLPEEFVCRRLFPRNYKVKMYNLKSYREYLEKKIFCKDMPDTAPEEKSRQEKVEKIIAVLQQFIIYLAHVSKGAPKKMVQLFESFVEIRVEKDKNKRGNTLVVQKINRKSKYFLTFNYYKQYAIGVIAYMITPIFYRLAESNIKEHSDKLLISSLRFVDFLFKFHKQSFSWKHLDVSPEMMEVNRAPELKSVVVDLLNYLAQVHIDRSSFSLTEYKFNGVIANEIFAMTKTDEVFSALFSFSLDEMLPLKKHYKDLLEKTEKEYKKNEKTSVFIDAISSLQGVLGDLHYYDDELEDAEVYYKNAVQALRKTGQKKGGNSEKDDEKMNHEQLYMYVRNMLRLGIIYERRKQYDFAYLTYGELCKLIIRERNIDFRELGIGVELRKEHDYTKDQDKDIFVRATTSKEVDNDDRNYRDSLEIPKVSFLLEKCVPESIASLQPLNFGKISPKTYDTLFKRMTYEGLKMLYLPFIAKLQILEQSHIGGITRNHLVLLDKEFGFLTFIINRNEAKILMAESYSRVADILYYKNSDLKCKNGLSRKDDDDRLSENSDEPEILPENTSCSACYYYHKALSILLNLDKQENKDKNTVLELLRKSVEQIKKINTVNVKYGTTLARILSDWGNVFFSCDNKSEKCDEGCYICDGKTCNTQKSNYPCACYICGKSAVECDSQCACIVCGVNDCETSSLCAILEKYINHVSSESNEENMNALLTRFRTGNHFTKLEIAFAMYTISTMAYRRANQYKRSAYQIYKMLCLFKYYNVYNCAKSKEYIEQLSKQAIHYLWYANDDLNIPELNKRKKDFGKFENDGTDKLVPLQNLLVDTEITKVRILVKELELKKVKQPEDLKTLYALRITSPYKVNYSVVGRIYRLRLKAMVNHETYRQLINVDDDSSLDERSKIERILKPGNCDQVIRDIFGEYIHIKENEDKSVADETKIEILDNLMAESIYCLIDIVQLLKTMGDTYLFTNSFLGLIHVELSLWIRRYETYVKYREKDTQISWYSRVEKYLKKYLDEEWREMLSGYRENQQALLHYYRCLEMHNEGRAYHNMIDILCYVRDDYNNRSDHFNIAEERHLITNGEIEKKIKELEALYKESKIYKVENYFEKIPPPV